MTPEPASTAPSTTFVARRPDDVLAVIPVLLGFEPEESLVMLTFGGDRPFHARIDLPSRRSDLPEMIEALLQPARQHDVQGVFLVGYGADGGLAELAIAEATRAFQAHDIVVIDGLRADGWRWWTVPARPGAPADGVPYDLGAHPFAAQAVYDGRVVHSSREQLRASIVADPDAVGRVIAGLAVLPGAPMSALAEGEWARALVLRRVEHDLGPTDAEVARLLRGLLELRVRDAAWSPLRRETSRAHVDFWADVLRRTPDPLAAAPAALLAFAAWQAGEGALAWCALDRCTEVEPDYSLARLIARALTEAISPDTWEEGFDWTEGLAG